MLRRQSIMRIILSILLLIFLTDLALLQTNCTSPSYDHLWFACILQKQPDLFCNTGGSCAEDGFFSKPTGGVCPDNTNNGTKTPYTLCHEAIVFADLNTEVEGCDKVCIGNNTTALYFNSTALPPQTGPVLELVL